jgi:hypothetical protein
MQDKIKDLAYRLWQEAGSPEGRDLEYWLAAEAQLNKAKPKVAKPKAPAKPKAAAAPAKPKAAKKALVKA